MIQESSRDFLERYKNLSKEGKVVHFLAILIVTLILGTFFTDVSIYYIESSNWQEERIYEFEEDTIIPDPFCFQIDSQGNYHFVYQPLHENSWNSTKDGMKDNGHYRYAKTSQNGDILFEGNVRDVRLLENLPVISDDGNYLCLDNSYCADRDNNVYYIYTGYNSYLKETAIVLVKWDDNGTMLFLRHITMPWAYGRFFHEEVSLSISTDGHIMGVFLIDQMIHFFKITTEGELLEAEQIDPRPGVFLTRFPNGVDIAENSRGDVYLVWNVCITYDDEWDLSYDAIILARLSADFTVKDSQRITYDQFYVSYPTIAIDNEDQVHVQCVVPKSYSKNHNGGFLSVRKTSECSDPDFSYYPIFIVFIIFLWIAHFLCFSLMVLWKNHKYLTKTFFACVLILLCFTIMPISLESDLNDEINAYPNFGDSTPYLDLFMILFIFLIASLFIKLGWETRSKTTGDSKIDQQVKREKDTKENRRIRVRKPNSGLFQQRSNGHFKKSSTWFIIIQSIIIVIILILPLEFADDIRYHSYSSGESIFLNNETSDNLSFSCNMRIRHNITENSRFYDFPIWKGAQLLNITLKGDWVSQSRDDNIDLYFNDPNGKSVDSSRSNNTNESLEFGKDDLHLTGSYTLEIRWVHSQETVNYTLTISVQYPFNHR